MRAITRVDSLAAIARQATGAPGRRGRAGVQQFCVHWTNVRWAGGLTPSTNLSPPMPLLVLTALLALWAGPAIFAVTLCVVAGRSERRPQPLYALSSR